MPLINIPEREYLGRSSLAKNDLLPYGNISLTLT
jgi:hypothetical protein